MNNDDNEVKRLIEELDRLQIQIAKVNERLRQIDEVADTKTSGSKPKRDKAALSVGDTVEVTNKYKGRLGVRGTVLKITSAQVLIQEIGGDDVFRKYKDNVRRVR
jgi:hypothetical protein